MAIDGTKVAESEFLKKNVGKNKVFCAFFDPMSNFSNCFSKDFFDEVRGGCADGGVGRMGLECVEITGDSADVFIDRPFIIVQNDDEFFGGFGNVI